MESKYKIIFPAGYNIYDIYRSNIDINVVTPDGNIYFGTLFTVENVKSLLAENPDKWFWSTDMCIVERLDIKSVVDIVGSIIEDGCLERVFSKIGSLSNKYSQYSQYSDLPDVLEYI
jgi:hypothetical protein